MVNYITLKIEGKRYGNINETGLSPDEIKNIQVFKDSNKVVIITKEGNYGGVSK